MALRQDTFIGFGTGRMNTRGIFIIGGRCALTIHNSGAAEHIKLIIFNRPQ